MRLKIGPCAGLIAFSLLVPQRVWAANFYRINQGSNQQVDEFSICKEVDNNSGQDLFVPTKTALEWLGFRNFPPSGVTLNSCAAVPADAVTDLNYSGISNSSVSLFWTEPNDNGTAITDYLIEYKETSSGTWLVFNDGTSTATTVTVTGLLPSTSYDFRVAPLNGAQGAYSNIVVQSTAPNDPFFNPSVYSLMNCGGAVNTKVVALDDNTEIELNGSPLAGSPINAGQVIKFNSTLGDVITANRPVFAAGRLATANANQQEGNIAWNTPSWAATEFITVGSRNQEHVITVYAFENTNITISEGPTVHFNSDPVAAGNFRTYRVPNNAGYKIESSSALITAYQYSENSTNLLVVDNMPLLPSSKDIIGIPSQTGQYTTTQTTSTFNWYESDGTSGSAGLTGGKLTSFGGNGAGYAAPAARAISTDGIIGRSNADQDGNDSEPFVPKSFMKRRFVINNLSEWVTFASIYPAVIRQFDPSGSQGAPLTLTRTGSAALTPYHGRLTNVPEGTIFESDVVFQAWYESDEASEASSAMEDETVLVGDYGVFLPVNHKLKLWLDASDASTLFQNDDCTGIVSLDGQSVGCWRDKSYQANHVVQDGSNKPVFKESVVGFGNQRGVDFDGGTNYLKFNASIVRGTEYTVFAVVHRDSTAANNYFFGTQSASANEGLHLGFSADGQARLGQVSNNLDATISGQTDDSVGIIWGRLDSTGKKVYYNSVTNTDATVTQLGGTGQGVIGRGFDTNGFDGQLAELIVYNRALSDAEIDLMRSYLNEKWLVPNLIDEIRLWLDASDISRIFTDVGCTTNATASGANVLCWQDRSGRNYLAKQATGTPVWQADGARSIVTFTNDSLSIEGNPAGAVFDNGKNLTEADVFAVVKSASAVETGFLFHHPAGNRMSAHVPWSGNAQFDLDAGASGTISAAWGADTVNYFLWNFTSDSGAGYQSIIRDSTLVTSDANASSLTIGTEDFHVGAESGTSNFQNMNLGALLIFDKRLATDQRDMVRGYLKNRWDLNW